MLQEIYKQMLDFYEIIEEEYADLFADDLEWVHLHFKFLIYYLVRYGVDHSCKFLVYHYRASYRLYLEKLIAQRNLITC